MSTPTPPPSVAGVPTQIGLADVREIELSSPLPTLDPGSFPHALVLVRLCHEPIGMIFRPFADIDEPARLAAAICADLALELGDAVERHGFDRTELGPGGLPHGTCRYRTPLEAAAAQGPPISVVLATRNGEATLRRALTSVLESRYPTFEIVVVDNGSSTDATERICREVGAGLADPDRVRYVSEPAPGLSRARNAGLRGARYEIVVYIDDDERADPWWLAAIGAEFGADRHVGVVSGIILPLELETDAQVRFERFGGHSKGRGFHRTSFDPAFLAGVQSAMYPVPPFGAGGNMAFRRGALEQIGGFDIALGAGTPAAGNEDTHAISEVLLAGWQGVYTPSAITWHPHHRDDVDRRSQLTGYARGLGAYYAAIVLRDPRRLVALARLAPQALRHARGAPVAGDETPIDPSAADHGPIRPSMDARGLIRGAGRYLSDHEGLLRRCARTRRERSTARARRDRS